MIKISDVIIDTAGNGIHNATVAITTYPAGAPATLYSDNGVTALASNSVLTDEFGQFEFYLPNGRYSRTISKAGATTVIDLDAYQVNDLANMEIANGKTFTVNNTITLSAADGASVTLPASGTLATTGATQSWDGEQTFNAAVTVADNLTVTGPTSLTTLATSGNATVGGTLSAATLNLTTVSTSGLATLESASVTNNLGVGGTSTLAGVTATTLAASGNTTVGGTLGVTGATTLAGTTTTTLSATTLTTSGAATLNSATVTNNATVGGTLSVTGTSTFTGAAAFPAGATLGGKTITLGGDFTTSGAFASTFTMTGATTLTFPTSGTVLSTGNFALSHIPTTGATNGDVLTLVAGEWAPVAPSGGSGGAGSFTTLDASGATTLGSTLGVSGATTLSTTLSAAGDVSLATNGGAATYVYIGKVASENGIQLYGRGSGSAPRIGAYGLDASITLQISSKLTGSIDFYTRTFSASAKQFSVVDTFNTANWLTATGNVTGSAPILAAAGSDTNIDIRVTPKGTGMLSTTGLKIDEGSNKRMGTATLTSGTVTVSTTAVTANSRIFLTPQAAAGTPGWLRVSARTAGTSFTVTSSSGSDASMFAWMLVEPA